jgi:hypothetical protein
VDTDPDSIGSVDPDPYSESGSGSKRAKMTHKSRKKFLRAEGFFYNLDIPVLYGGLGIGKLQFLIKKKKKNFSCNFLVIFGH